MMQRVTLGAAIVAAALLAALGLSLTLQRPPPVSPARPGAVTESPSPQPSADKPSRPLIGVFIKAPLTSWQPEQAFGAAIGVPVKLGLAYAEQGGGFPRRFAQAAYMHGAQALIQIQPTTQPLRAIAAGRYDTWIRTYASEVRAFGHPVVLGFAHEMNGGWYSWGKQPAAFVAAWRHIVTLFRQQGATNVTWLWTADSGSTNPARLRLYWPGSAYVGWVGIDGYYYRPVKHFAQIFAPSIREVRTLTRAPILLAETAIGPAAGQTRMLSDLFRGIRRYHLLGLVWFDVDQHGGLYHQDWRLEDHPVALAAFRRAALALEGRKGAPAAGLFMRRRS